MTDLSIPVASALDSRPGRNCPIDYHYSAQAIAAAAPLSCDGAWIVGGLYGNPLALDLIEQAVAAERRPAALLFNGDFHWFDAQPDWFDQIQQGAMRHHALRGNVETESARTAFDPDIGCGCAYPSHVGEGVVERSNRILAKLWQTCARTGHAASLAQLPMYRHVRVADARIAVVHGDLESLAGWSFDGDALRDAGSRARAEQLLTEAPFDIVASSHTCAPVMQQFGHTVLINNGAAGMGNFQRDPAGVITRVGHEPLAALGQSRLDALRLRVLHSQQHAGVWIEAVAIDFDLAAFQRRFLALWPPGSDGYESYAMRIANGTSLTRSQAFGQLPAN